MIKQKIFYLILIILLFSLIFCNHEKNEPSSPSPIEEPENPPEQDELSSIKLATWNIRYLSIGSRDDTELSQIAEILKRYDLIAIQEGRDTTVLNRLKNMMPGYNYIASALVGTTQKELYTYFYRTAAVSTIGGTYLYSDPNDDFIREPYVASFKAGNFDFTLITIHVLFGDIEAERREEIKLLDEVLAQVDNDNGAENDTILLGDFNFDRSDSGWQITTHQAVVSPNQMTTISDSSSYDNMWINPDETVEYNNSLEIYRFDELVFGNDDDAASLAVSDHRPVSVIFKTDLPDDD